MALAGAVLWGLIAMLVKLQLALIGLLIGAGIGVVVARYRAGHRPTMIAGAVIAVAGCALGTFLAMVFQAMNAHFPLSFVLGHLSGPHGLLHYYPANVGIIGLFFWAVAAYAAIRIPLQSQRLAARRAAVTPVWGQTQGPATQPGDPPSQAAEPMFIRPAEPEPGPDA